MTQEANNSELKSLKNVDVQIKKILLATDGSIPAIQATEYSVALAKVMGAKIKAVFVESDDGIFTDGIIDKESLKESHPSSAGLEVAQLYAKKNNVVCETVVIRGSIVKAIIKAAEDYGANIIIVGNTGRTGLRRVALGSVAEAVVKNSRIPVLVLKAN